MIISTYLGGHDLGERGRGGAVRGENLTRDQIPDVMQCDGWKFPSPADTVRLFVPVARARSRSHPSRRPVQKCGTN